MSKLSMIVGVVILLLGLYQGGKYVLDYNSLTSYGQGYVWGSILLIICGAVLIVFGLKKRKSSR
ncbi:MAG: hypothetical protein HQ472_00910 [Ignavibacteria bacterium]|nr:hypothetical protein [Ignavibacteria bacterium]